MVDARLIARLLQELVVLRDLVVGLDADVEHWRGLDIDDPGVDWGLVARLAAVRAWWQRLTRLDRVYEPWLWNELGGERPALVALEVEIAVMGQIAADYARLDGPSREAVAEALVAVGLAGDSLWTLEDEYPPAGVAALARARGFHSPAVLEWRLGLAQRALPPAYKLVVSSCDCDMHFETRSPRGDVLVDVLESRVLAEFAFLGADGFVVGGAATPCTGCVSRRAWRRFLVAREDSRDSTLLWCAVPRSAMDESTWPRLDTWSQESWKLAVPRHGWCTLAFADSLAVLRECIQQLDGDFAIGVLDFGVHEVHHVDLVAVEVTWAGTAMSPCEVEP